MSCYEDFCAIPTDESGNLSCIKGQSIQTTQPKSDLTVAALREYPSRLFVETTTRCNLKCGMCMKQTAGSGIREGDMRPEIFAALLPALPHCEALILNGIGEPLLHRHLVHFIKQAKPHMPAKSWIGFQSNGLLINPGIASSLVQAGLNRICLSMDAVSPETFRKIREGGEVQDMEHALAALDGARRFHRSELSIGVEFVIMRENAKELPRVLRWAADKGVGFAIVSHLLPYEKEHAGSIAYETNTDEAIAFFKPWRKRAELEGIDLWRYFKIVMNYLRSPEDQRIMDFVWSMHQQAREEGLFINLKNLLMQDEIWLQTMGELFAEAENVAREKGIELHLPAITPRNTRACDFVEKGGAFISWDGGVHNCYFLWHQYSCFSSSSRKYVVPKSFGKLPDQSLKDIWNSTEFRDYRLEVLRKEYPVCSNCSLVPCEYVYNDNFEQDCYASTVACGDCFWSMGLFRCLQ